MSSAKEEPEQLEYYWRIHCEKNHEEVRFMKYNPEENWALFSDRICKKMDLNPTDTFPLHYVSTFGVKKVLVNDQEDYEVCILAMKTFEGSRNHLMGFNLYLKQHRQMDFRK